MLTYLTFPGSNTPYTSCSINDVLPAELAPNVTNRILRRKAFDLVFGISDEEGDDDVDLQIPTPKQGKSLKLPNDGNRLRCIGK